MIRGIIFDMDGVIVDSGHLHLKAWQEFLARYGRPHTKEEFKKYFGVINFELFYLLLPELPKERHMELDNEKETLYRKYADLELLPLPGAKSLIKRLYEEGFKLIVGSSGNPKNIEFNLKKLDLFEYFAGYVSSHDVKFGKPNPEVFLKSAQKLGLKPEECVVIEDAHHGVQAAKSAGMKVIAITSTHDKGKLIDADLIVDSLDEITIEKIKEFENE